MQIKQTLSKELKREYDITVPADTINKQVDARLAELGKTIKMPGFRPGKIPLKRLEKEPWQKM